MKEKSATLKNYKYNNILFFYIPLMIFVMSSYFRTFQSFFNYFEVIATGLLLLGIFWNLNKITKKEMMRMLIVGVVTGIIFLVSKDITIIKFFLFIFSAYNIKFNQCVKFDLIIRMICFITVLILNALDIIPSFDITRGDIMRYSFGFYHPNDFAYKILIMLFEYFYLNNFKSVFRNSIITLFIVCFLDYYTNSRTAELLITFVFLFGTVLNKIKTPICDNKIIKHMISNSYFYFALVILISFILFRSDNEFGYKINKILSSRLYYINGYYNEFGITLFGNNFNDFMSITNSLDVGFAHILIRYGIVAFVSIGIAFRKVFNVIFERKNISYVVILFSFVIYMLTENSFLRIEKNIFMLIFVILFRKREDYFFEK